MFNDIYEDDEKVYKFKLERLNVSDEAELLLKLKDCYIVDNLLKFNSTTFKEEFGVYSKEILKELKKYGYRLSGGEWERNGRILVNSISRNNGLMI